MTKHADNYKDAKSSEKRKRKQAYGNPIKTHDIPGTTVHGKLRHDESWVSRGFVKDLAYDRWGK
jgi:hypothetical protein